MAFTWNGGYDHTRQAIPGGYVGDWNTAMGKGTIISTAGAFASIWVCLPAYKVVNGDGSHFCIFSFVLDLGALAAY